MERPFRKTQAFGGSWLHRGALLLALFGASGQLLSVAHLLLVPHAVCAEHGELIHVDAARANEASSGKHAPAPANSATSTYSAATDDAVSDHHDHCLVSALRREKLVVPQPHALLVPASAAPAVVAIALAAKPQRAISLLQLAPKSSPPALHA